jgi:hypothetical protein
VLLRVDLRDAVVVALEVQTGRRDDAFELLDRGERGAVGRQHAVGGDAARDLPLVWRGLAVDAEGLARTLHPLGAGGIVGGAGGGGAGGRQHQTAAQQHAPMQQPATGDRRQVIGRRPGRAGAAHAPDLAWTASALSNFRSLLSTTRARNSPEPLGMNQKRTTGFSLIVKSTSARITGLPA